MTALLPPALPLQPRPHRAAHARFAAGPVTAAPQPTPTPTPVPVAVRVVQVWTGMGTVLGVVFGLISVVVAVALAVGTGAPGPYADAMGEQPVSLLVLGLIWLAQALVDGWSAHALGTPDRGTARTVITWLPAATALAVFITEAAGGNVVSAVVWLILAIPGALTRVVLLWVLDTSRAYFGDPARAIQSPVPVPPPVAGPTPPAQSNRGAPRPDQRRAGALPDPSPPRPGRPTVRLPRPDRLGHALQQPMAFRAAQGYRR
jgi:hypothetical protein